MADSFKKSNSNLMTKKTKDSDIEMYAKTSDDIDLKKSGTDGSDDDPLEKTNNVLMSLSFVDRYLCSCYCYHYYLYYFNHYILTIIFLCLLKHII